MRNRVTNGSLKEMLNSLNVDAATASRKKMESDASASATRQNKTASALASTMPKGTLIPEISVSDAKRLTNEYYKPMLRDAKAAAAAEKQAEKAAAKAATAKAKAEKSAAQTLDEPGSFDWGKFGAGSNSNDATTKPATQSKDETQKKKNVFQRGMDAVKEFFSPEQKRTVDPDDIDTTRTQSAVYHQNLRNAKAAEKDENAIRASMASNADLASKKKLNEQDKQEIYTRVNTWKEQGDNDRLLNVLNHAKRNGKVAELLDLGYTQDQLDEAEQYAKLYDRIGYGYTAGTRIGNTATGLGKTIASAAPMALESAATAIGDDIANFKNDEYRTAHGRLQSVIAQMTELENSGNAYALDVNGQPIGMTREYSDLVDQKNKLEATMEEVGQRNAVSKDSAGYRLYQSGQKDLARSDLGLDPQERMLKGAATSAAENLAIAAVNPALVLPVLSAQGAADSMGKDIENGVAAGKTLGKGIAKFGAGWAINSVGVAQMVDTMGVGGAKQNLASNIVRWMKDKSVLSGLANSNPTLYAVIAGATDNGLQSFAENIADRGIDAVAGTGENISIEQLMNESLQAAGQGALGGAFTGLAGSGVNAMMRGNRAVNYANALDDLSAAETVNANNQSLAENFVLDEPGNANYYKLNNIGEAEVTTNDKTSGKYDGRGVQEVRGGIRSVGELGSGGRAAGVAGGEYLPANRILLAEQLNNNDSVFTETENAENGFYGITDLNLRFADDNADYFSQALATAKANNKNGGAVDAHSAEDIARIVSEGGHVFMSPDGTAGGAVEANGNLTAVFKDDLNNSRQRAGSSIALAAVKNGATKGDCFGMFLVNTYSRAGFEPVARMAYTYGYNDEMDAQVRKQIASGIIAKEPDVYVLKLRDGGFLSARDNYNTAKRYTPEELDALPEFVQESPDDDAYSRMLEYRDSLIRKGDGGYGANTVGSAESKFGRTVAPNMDIAEQSGVLDDLSDGAMEAYGESNQLYHDVYSHDIGESEAAQDMELRIQEHGGDITAAVNAEVANLNNVSEWGAGEQYRAKEARNRVKQQLNEAVANNQDTADIAARLHAIDDMISAQRSKIGQALEASKEAPITSDNVRQKYSQYKQQQAQKWARQNKTQAGAMEELAETLSKQNPDADLKFIKEYIQRMAKAKNVDLTDAQVDKLAALSQMGAKTEHFYNTLLEFGSEVADLTLDQLEQIDNLVAQAEELPDDSRERVELESKIYAIMAENRSSSFADKLNAWRYLAMLGNSKTHVRNLIGNQSMGMVTGMKDTVATILEHGIIRNKADRTKAVLTGADRGILAAAYKEADNHYRELTSGSRFNIERGIKNETRVFDNGVLETARKANNAALEESDYSGIHGELAVVKELGGPAGKWAESVMAKAAERGEKGKVGQAGLRNQFARSLAQQIKAKGYNESILTSTDGKDRAIVASMVEQAIKDAKRATYHEDSMVANWLNEKSMPKALRLFIEAELPFKATPINVVSQAARYSPAGFIKAATYDAYKLHSGQITASQFVDDLSMGLTGTGIMAVGAILGSMGIIRVPDADDNKEKLDKLQGKQGYAVVIGDKSYTIDWLAPAALPLLMGATLADSVNKNGLGLGTAMDVLNSMADPMIESTMLSSLSDTLESVRYAESGTGLFSTIMTGAATNYLGQYVPTALGHVARTVDNTRRSNQAFSDSKTVKQAKYFARKQVNKIPGLGAALDKAGLFENAAYVDAWGRTGKNGPDNAGARLGYNTLSPGYMTDINTTAADSFIEDLYDDLTDSKSSVIPKVSAGDADFELTPASFEKYASTKGKAQYEMIDDLANQKYVDELPADIKKNIVTDIYTVANIDGNKSVDPDWKPNSESAQKQYDIYKKLGASGYVDYLASSKALNEISSSKNPHEVADMLANTLDDLGADAFNNLSDQNQKYAYIAKEKGADVLADYLGANKTYNAAKKAAGDKTPSYANMLDDLKFSPSEAGYIYAMHSSKDSKAKAAYEKYGEIAAYWVMKANAIGLGGNSNGAKLNEFAYANIDNQSDRDTFIKVMTKSVKDW